MIYGLKKKKRCKMTLSGARKLRRGSQKAQQAVKSDARSNLPTVSSKRTGARGELEKKKEVTPLDKKGAQNSS